MADLTGKFFALPRDGDTRTWNGRQWTYAGRWWDKHSEGTRTTEVMGSGPPPALKARAQRAAKARAGRSGRS